MFSLKWSCYIFSLKLFDCAQVALLFPGNDVEWPMFCRNVDSFLFRQISGSRFVHFFIKSHAEIFREFRHDLCYKLGHIECPGFAAPGRSQRSWKAYALFMSLFILLGQVID